MTVLEVPPRPALVEARLTRGAELLFDMECRGDTGDDYHRWLQAWTELLAQYREVSPA